jgi:hypothetical protein
MQYCPTRFRAVDCLLGCCDRLTGLFGCVVLDDAKVPRAPVGSVEISFSDRLSLPA